MVVNRDILEQIPKNQNIVKKLYNKRKRKGILY